ncbi:type II secretion system F family protein [Actinomadura roseirufa]|uniref:type II secretion system F family protein n=1 Tax=Actinomadura roseirufa TaxID=2094049 RepID=UPI001F5F67CC|nr:type II secretion system F family protein [Actinomadura roseirufa]
MTLPYIALLLAVTLACAVWGAGDLAAGWERRRGIANRSRLEGEAPPDGPLAVFDRRLRRTELGRVLARRITAAGLAMRVSTFLLLMVLGGCAAILLIGQLLGPLFGVAAAVAVGAVFFGYLRRREDRRKEEFIAQLPELARVLSNAAQAGLSLRTAIGLAADELDDPARTELRRAADGLRLGQSLDAALGDLAERLPSRELGVLVSTLLVSARSGGSLVTALRSIAETLDDRKEIRREVRTILGQAVVSNWAVGILGIAGIAMINQIQPGGLREMSAHPVGQIMLAVGAALFVASLVIIRRITRIDV